MFMIFRNYYREKLTRITSDRCNNNKWKSIGYKGINMRKTKMNKIKSYMNIKIELENLL